MKKNNVRGILLIVILLVVFCLVAFLPPFAKTPVFWIAFLFGILATLIQVYFFRYSWASGSTAKSRFYGIPIARVGIIYFVVQWIASIVELIFAARFTTWIVFLIDVIIFAIAILGGIVTDTVRQEIERQDTKLQKDVSTMRELQSLAITIVGQCEEPSLKKEMSKVSDEIRYSDPVASEGTAALEAEMLGQLREIQAAVIDGNGEAAKALAEKVLVNLTERNRICKLYK